MYVDKFQIQCIPSGDVVLNHLPMALHRIRQLTEVYIIDDWLCSCLTDQYCPYSCYSLSFIINLLKKMSNLLKKSSSIDTHSQLIICLLISH